MDNGIYTIIATYNAAPWIEKCMEALMKSSCPTQVIVVDNCSVDNTKELLKQYLGHISLIENKSNLGFGGANNQGIQCALEKGARYFFLLNQDAYVFENTIGLLKNAIDQYGAYGIISALQMQPNKIEIDKKMRAYITRSFPKFNMHEVNAQVAGIPMPLRFVNAASWMLSRACILKTGLFHPIFTHYGEDNHYCSRAQFHGFKTGFLPTAQVIHDRNEDTYNAPNHLITGIHTTPLYTALDLRKIWPLAWILSQLKIRSAYRKLIAAEVPNAKQIYFQEKKWFHDHKSDILRVRKETMKPWKKSLADAKLQS